MKGITMQDLRDCISHGHEAEFIYKDKLYVMQPEVIDNKLYLAIWNCEKDGSCICRYGIHDQDIISKDAIDGVLNEKCFDGKSFYEIESDITVVNIF